MCTTCSQNLLNHEKFVCISDKNWLFYLSGAVHFNYQVLATYAGAQLMYSKFDILKLLSTTCKVGEYFFQKTHNTNNSLPITLELFLLQYLVLPH